ncbi:IS4 family transposase [Candidatus Parabeggiatoa sp. HSG14]|uniref:IS4 family transposase n=1 Tax=Candidatus Parabeggiatoa sp. HSG14 TaxID=3055593 RepID=UPI0025A83803|nr:IS4 family transposase [Thiotrichales bacterium HSG14]
MFHSIRNRISKGIDTLKKQFLQEDGLPFNDILQEDNIQQIVNEEVGEYRERVYSPITTLSAFVCQILNEDNSCQAAVERVRASLVAREEIPCSSATGAYCKARERLPENLILRTMRDTGQNLHTKSLDIWKWKNRHVVLVDGTTVSMPDTEENQKLFPQPNSQKPGLGFPIARLVGLISLSSGALLNVAIGPYQGKETGEHALLREILDTLSPGDILLADRYYCSYFLIAILLAKGVDVVFQNHASRKTDFRRGKRLGKRDHLATWHKPDCPDWMDKIIYASIPETLTIREVKRNSQVIVTTLNDPSRITRQEIIDLYSKRWNIEIDLKFIKEVLQMDILCCKTPSMVRKEIAVHLLAYNLIRTIIAQAACLYDINPRMISFKGAIQSFHAFIDKIFLLKRHSSELIDALLQGVASHRIGRRSGRCEPRAVKRRPKSFPRLKEPRKIAQSRLMPCEHPA